MKKTLILLIAFILFGCSNEKFTGYLVAKEYTPERMCCDGTKTICYAGFLYVHIPTTHTHRHQKLHADYYWYVANKCQVIKKRVSKETFYSKKLGSKIIIKL